MNFDNNLDLVEDLISNDAKSNVNVQEIITKTKQQTQNISENSQCKQIAVNCEDVEENLLIDIENYKNGTFKYDYDNDCVMLDLSNLNS